MQYRGVARGGARGARPEPPHPEFGSQVTLFKPWGADYARHSTASPPGFKMLSTPLLLVMCALCALRTSSSFADERLYLLELTSDLNFELRIQLIISFILILVEG